MAEADRRVTQPLDLNLPGCVSMGRPARVQWISGGGWPSALQLSVIGLFTTPMISLLSTVIVGGTTRKREVMRDEKK